MKDVYEVLKEKGITLPAPPPKGGVYTPVQEFGEKFLYCSGCGPDLGEQGNVIGKLGKDLSLEEGQKAAYNCMLNLLANLNEKTGDLNRIKRFVKVLAFVNSTDDFGMQPQVVNGGSNLIKEIFGEEAGLPARSAIGVNALPGGNACESEVLVELKQVKIAWLKSFFSQVFFVLLTSSHKPTENPCRCRIRFPEILRMPLNAEEKGVSRHLRGLDNPVRGLGGGGEPGS